MSFGFKYVYVTIFWKEGSLQSTYYIYYIVKVHSTHTQRVRPASKNTLIRRSSGAGIAMYRTQ